MDVDVGHARHHRPVALVDDGCAGGRSEAVLDPRDPPVLDDNGRRSARGLRGIDDQASGLDGVGFGAGGGSGSERHEGGQQFPSMQTLPFGCATVTGVANRFKWPWRAGYRCGRLRLQACPFGCG